MAPPDDAPRSGALNPRSISLRLATPDDHDFAFHVCRTTMAEHHRQARGWDDAAIDAAIESHLDLASSQVILQHGEPVGLLLLKHGPIADWLVRMVLLPEAQGHGIGSFLLRQLQKYSTKTHRPIRLTVYKCNPAGRLYRRHGFEVVSESDIELEMIWRPTTTA